MKIIVGLGNPGKKYEATRHNIGFMTIDKIARTKSVSVRETGEGYLSGSSNVEGEEIILAKPMTYMNRSGEAVRRLLADYKGNLQDLVVIHDDMDMALGRVRIKTK
ncbi:MAG TPA: aminoacyl-tRNA hydrolase, partial [Nitrospiria bacterium]|nr:aminoacyl-tRNA hydrolase [Nitrospiria bacterium]